MSLDDFNVESSESGTTCWDKVYVRDGPSETALAFEPSPLCGNQSPGSYSFTASTDQGLYIEFTTDSSIQWTGFQMTISVSASPGMF